MKIINKVTFEIKDINIEQVKLLVTTLNSKYDNFGNILNEIIVLDTSTEDLILTFVKQSLGENWILYSEFNDWLAIDTDEKKYIYRVIVNQGQRDKIADEHPEFLMMLNEGVPNPKFKIGDIWEIYVTQFAEGVREYLENINIFNPIILIETKPNETI